MNAANISFMLALVPVNQLRPDTASSRLAVVGGNQKSPHCEQVNHGIAIVDRCFSLFFHLKMLDVSGCHGENLPEDNVSWIQPWGSLQLSSALGFFKKEGLRGAFGGSESMAFIVIMSSFIDLIVLIIGVIIITL